MRKNLLTLVSYFAGVSLALAQTTTPNHVQFPYSANTPSGKYAAMVAPGGISTNNIVTGATGSPTLDNIWNYADNSVQKQQINAANGIAGLDSNSNVTSNISTGKMFSSLDFQVGTQPGNNYPNSTSPQAVQLGGYQMWYGNRTVLGRYPDASQPGGYTNVGDWWITPPETLHLGGQTEGASGFLNIHCSPYSGSNAGTCSQVMLGTANIQAQAAGIGPGATGLANYDNFDVVNQTLQSTDSIPLYVITSNSASNVFPPASDGLDHTPVFTATGATFANPLPVDMSNWFINHYQQGIRVMTNEVGCQNCAIPTYAGVVTGLTRNINNQVTGITVPAWQVLNSHVNTANQVPGYSTTDGSAPALDTTWTKFGAPAIMVGVFTKVFNQYSLCTLNGPQPTNGRGDINAPAGGANNQLHVCEGWEMDLWNNDPKDFRPVLHGMTVAFSKQPRAGQPSLDSYNFNSAGATSKSFLQSGEYWTIPFAGQNFAVSSYEGTQYAAGSVKNVVQWRQSERVGYESDGGWPRNNIMPGIWTVRNVAASSTGATGTEDPNNSSKDITTNIGVQVDWYGAQNTGANSDPLWNSPTQEHIELNPASNHNGINLCQNNQTDTSCVLQTGAAGVTMNASANVAGSLGVTQGINLSSKSPQVTFNTGSSDGNNSAVQMRYDLASNSMLFTNNHYGNTYSFNGAVVSNAAFIAGNGLELTPSMPRIKFDTGSTDSNNSSIEVRYDTPSNSLLFTNNHYGNTYSFNGPITSTGSIYATNGLGLSSTLPKITFNTGAADGNNTAIEQRYDLATNTMYFTNNHAGNTFSFNGNLVATAAMSAPVYKETLTTPASSSAPCSAGQFTDDANYHYVCVATNTWKRSALSSF